ncbi:MAG: asparagine synthase [Bacteroidota bacterium]|jgi:asparagine synthase (glutamine-hydrolysing)
MCGIVGQIKFEKQIDKSLMMEALNSLHHRGPDAGAHWCNTSGNVWLGHRRLSILDLSDAGTQPMQSEDGKLVVVFNGEIYNFKTVQHELIQKGYHFKSSSDTEVLLNAWHCWGEASLDKLNGMFAFGIYNNATGELVIARDRIGEKPLYFYLYDGNIIFASEVKAIFHAYSGTFEINPASVDCLLGMGYVPGRMSMVKGIQKILPGHFARWKPGQNTINEKSFWQFPLYSGEEKQQELQLEEFDELLKNAVNAQLVSDVPVGVMLSGGLDSSLVTAYAAEADQDIYTFTVGFEGFGGADERHFARQISQWYGTRHKELNIAAVQPELLTRLAAQCCEPSTDPAIIPGSLIYSSASKYCKVVMGGDGGDEIFGGYDRYQSWSGMKQRYSNWPTNVRKTVSTIAEDVLPMGLVGRHYLMQLDTDFEQSLPLHDTLFTESERKKLLPDGFDVNNNIRYKQELVTANLPFMERAMMFDIKGFMPDNILTKVDRSSMLSSMEVRSPLLSREVIEFALTRLSSQQRNKKQFLRELGKKKLPSFFNMQRKQGFIPPLEFWLKEKAWKEFIQDHLLSGDTIFNNRLTNKLMKDTGKYFFNKRRLFALLMFQLWVKEYKISF